VRNKTSEKDPLNSSDLNDSKSNDDNTSESSMLTMSKPANMHYAGSSNSALSSSTSSYESIRSSEKPPKFKKSKASKHQPSMGSDPAAFHASNAQPFNVINNNTLGYQTNGHVMDPASANPNASPSGYSIQNILNFAAQQYASANADVHGSNSTASQQQQLAMMSNNSGSQKRKHASYSFTHEGVGNVQGFAKENLSSDSKQSKFHIKLYQ
jgi:hypothetical protein